MRYDSDGNRIIYSDAGARTTFLGFPAYSVLPFVAWFFHPYMSTVYIAAALMITLAVLDYKGLRPKDAKRWIKMLAIRYRRRYQSRRIVQRNMANLR